MAGFNWEENPEFSERLKSMWIAGNTAAEVSKALGNGISRCAVIGRVRRMGLRGHKKLGVNPNPIVSRPAPIPKPIPIPLDAPSPLVPPETFPDKGCKQIDGDPGQPGWQMCGNPIEKGSYCAYHRARNFDLVRTANVRAQQR